MASNSTILDPQGDADDWIELKNTSNAAVDLSGMYLSDDRAHPKKRQFPAGTTIPAGGYLLIWADDDDGDSPGLHTNFKLSAGGESVVLSDTDANGNALIDAIDFPALGRDVSYGRTPEGSGPSRIRPAATPGALNPALAAPAITSVALTSTPSIDADSDGTPELYGAGETIEVTVTWDADVVWDVSDPDGVLADSVRWQWEVDDGKWQEDAAGWLVPDWQAVAGATGPTFTPSAALAGSAVRAVVRYADGVSGPDEPAKQATSASTDAIQQR